MWMQICLGIHGLIGGALAWIAIPVSFGGYDVLSPRAPGFGSLVAALGWFFAGWLIARARPMPPRHLQPEPKFSHVPAVIVFWTWVPAAVGFISKNGLLIMVPILAMMVCVAAGPICAATWAAARIRYHVGTWALAWAVSLVYLVLQLRLYIPMFLAD